MAAVQSTITKPTGGKVYPPGYGGTVPQSDELYKTLKSQGAKGGIDIVKATDDPIQGQLVSWSNEYNSTPEEILRTNNITNTGDIRPGQELAIPRGGGAAADSEFPDYSQGTVNVGGDTLSLEGDEDPMVQTLLNGVGAGVNGAPSATPVTEEAVAPVDNGVKGQITEAANEAFTAEGLTFAEEGSTSAVEDLSIPAPGDEGVSVTSTTAADEALVDFEDAPVDSPEQIAKAPVVQPGEKLVEKPEEEPSILEKAGLNQDLKQLTLDAVESVKSGIADEDTKSVFGQATQELTDLGLIETDKKYWEEIAKPIDKEIKLYNEKILAVAEEKYEPKFTGANKWLAVLGAMLGSYGSAMTGTPNFAMNILESSIERDQEMFLASKEIRTKTLERQRLDWITKRGELLQSAQNKTNEMLQVAGLKIQAASVDADIKQTQEELAEKIRTNKANYALEVKKMVVTFLSSEASREQAMSKDQRLRSVKGINLVDENGEPVLMQGYLATSEKEGIKLREARNDIANINDILNEMEPLYEEIAIFGPQVLSDKAVQLEQKYQQLLQLMKNINKMGANFTVSEQAMLKAQIPGANWTDKMGVAMVKLKGMRKRLISGWRNVRDTHSSEQVVVPVNKKKKLTTNLKSIGVKVPVNKPE